MKVVNLLEFLNKAKDLYTLNYAMCDNELVNFLDLMVEDEQFTQKIDLGIMFVNQKSLDQFVIVDGLNRICHFHYFFMQYVNVIKRQQLRMIKQ